MQVDTLLLTGLLHLLTDEERQVIERKFWGKESLRVQAVDEVDRHRLRAVYRSAIAKLKELLS